MRKTIEKLASLVLALIMVIGVLANPAFAANDKTFKDVPEDTWYYGYIMMLAQDDIVKGFGETNEFRPESKLTREQAAKMIAEAAKFDEKEGISKFKDVDPDGWATGYIFALEKREVVQGFGTTGEFRPKNNIQRGHAAKMVSLAFDLEESSLERELKGLPDNDDVVKKAIEVLASNGIVKGYGGTKEFRPAQEIDRAEFSKIVCIGMVASALQKAEADDATPEQIAEAQALLQRLIVAAEKDEDTEGLDHLQDRADALKLKVVSVSAVNATTIKVTLSDDIVHEVTLDEALKPNVETEVTFEIDGKEYTATVTWEVVDEPGTEEPPLVVEASWKDTGKVGTNTIGETAYIFQGYELLDKSNNRIDLVASNIEKMTVLDPGATEVKELTVGDDSDPLMWFNVRKASGDYKYTVKTKAGNIYEATLNWTASTQLEAEKQGTETVKCGDEIYRYHYIVDLDVTPEDSLVYRIKPNGVIDQQTVIADDDTVFNIYFRPTQTELGFTQQEGDHIYVFKKGDIWYQAVINYAAEAEVADPNETLSFYGNAFGESDFGGRFDGKNTNLNKRYGGYRTDFAITSSPFGAIENIDIKYFDSENNLLSKVSATEKLVSEFNTALSENSSKDSSGTADVFNKRESSSWTQTAWPENKKLVAPTKVIVTVTYVDSITAVKESNQLAESHLEATKAYIQARINAEEALEEAISKVKDAYTLNESNLAELVKTDIEYEDITVTLEDLGNAKQKVTLTVNKTIAAWDNSSYALEFSDSKTVTVNS